MISEVNSGVLFDCTVPCSPFETEGTGWTEVIIRHGRERQVEIRRPHPGQKASARGEARRRLDRLGNPQFMAVFSPIQLVASVPPLTRFFTLATLLLSLFYLYLQWKSE